MSPRQWRHRIADILEAIDKIQAYVGDTDFQSFAADSKTVDAVIRNFIVIGEAARRVPADVVERHPGIPWRLMGDMRDFAVHEYWGVKAGVAWETIQNDLPPLVPQLQQILDQEAQGL